MDQGAEARGGAPSLRSGLSGFRCVGPLEALASLSLARTDHSRRFIPSLPYHRDSLPRTRQGVSLSLGQLELASASDVERSK